MGRHELIRATIALDGGSVYLHMSVDAAVKGQGGRAITALMRARMCCEEAGLLLEIQEGSEAIRLRERVTNMEGRMRKVWESIEN